MGRHVFNFNGGEELTTMGAGWFVSFCYYKNIDLNHKNWNKIKTVSSRSSVYLRTINLHSFWLYKVLEMNNVNLNKNKLGLEANQIKEMAKKLLCLSKYK